MNKKYEDVKQYYSKYGCELLDGTYKNCDTNMRFKCKCGLIGIGTYRSFKRSKYKSCSICVAKHISQSNTNSVEYVRNIYIDNGCELLDEYKNNETPMKFKCSCGSITKKSFSNFRKTPKCKKCSLEHSKKTNMRTYEEVKQIFENSGCILISEEYTGCKVKLEYIASCGHRHFTTLDIFVNSGTKIKLCKECSKILVSGENNYNWKGGT